MNHRYTLVNRGVASLRLDCSCGWKSSTVSRRDGDVVYAQWQGHRKVSSS